MKNVLKYTLGLLTCAVLDRNERTLKTENGIDVASRVKPAGLT